VALTCGLKICGGTESCQFPTEEITGTKNFNFAPKFSKNGVFRTKFCIFGQSSDNTKNFHKCSDSPNEVQLLPVPVKMPLCPWVILVVAVAFRPG